MIKDVWYEWTIVAANSKLSMERQVYQTSTEAATLLLADSQIAKVGTVTSQNHPEQRLL